MSPKSPPIGLKPELLITRTAQMVLRDARRCYSEMPNKTNRNILDLWGYKAEAEAEAFSKSRSWSRSRSFEFLKPRNRSRSFGLKCFGFMKLKLKRKPKQLRTHVWNTLVRDVLRLGVLSPTGHSTDLPALTGCIPMSFQIKWANGAWRTPRREGHPIT